MIHFTHNMFCRFAVMTLAVAMVVVTMAASADAELIAYWKFDDDVTDSSGSTNTHNGTATSVNYSTTVPTEIGSGKSLDLTSTDGYVDIVAHDDLNSSVFTLSFWINQNGYTQSGTYSRVMSRAESETAVSGDGSLRYYESSTSWQDTGYDVPATGWKHIAFVVSSATPYRKMEVYAGGSLIYTGDFVGTPSGDMRIGGRDRVDDPAPIKALIDDMAFFDHVLTADEISGLADGTYTPLTVPEPSTLVLLGMGALALLLVMRRLRK